MKAGYVKYRIELKPKAVKNLRSLPKSDAARMAHALESLCDNLSGDVKKLTNFSPEYRLRVGNYRALFEIETPDLVMIYRIKHRKEIFDIHLAVNDEDSQVTVAWPDRFHKRPFLLRGGLAYSPADADLPPMPAPQASIPGKSPGTSFVRPGAWTDLQQGCCGPHSDPGHGAADNPGRSNADLSGSAFHA